MDYEYGGPRAVCRSCYDQGQRMNIEQCGFCGAWSGRESLQAVVIDAHHEEMGCSDCYEEAKLKLERRILQAYVEWVTA